jgi:hypothetical protein
MFHDMDKQAHHGRSRRLGLPVSTRLLLALRNALRLLP